MTVREALRYGSRYLRRRRVPQPEWDAELLLRTLLGCERTVLLREPHRPLDPPTWRRYRRWLRQRGAHYPLQYLRGLQEFYGREFLVSPAVLIPRPETETLVEVALECLQQDLPSPPPRVIDVGTGSGCLAVTLACERPQLCLGATDISLAALQVALENARRHGCQERILFLCGDLLEPFPKRPLFDLILCNPPYLKTEELETLDPSVRRFEPRQALLAGRSGLEHYQRLFQQARCRLREEGVMILELPYAGLQAVTGEAEASGWRLQRTRDDLAGWTRCAVFSPVR